MQGDKTERLYGAKNRIILLVAKKLWQGDIFFLAF
jgi:hypothetical protein